MLWVHDKVGDSGGVGSRSNAGVSAGDGGRYPVQLGR